MSDNDNGTKDLVLATTSDVSFIKVPNGLILNYNGETHQVLKTDTQKYEMVLSALKERRYSDIPEIVSVSARIYRYSNGSFRVENSQVYLGDEMIPGLLARKLVEYAENDLPCEPLIAFWNKIKLNPSEESKKDLYEFLDHNNHPITNDGNFIAYRKVRVGGDGVLRDIHTGTFDNSVGNVVEMPRSECDADRNVTCSRGLHVANWNYATQHFGSGADPMLEVEVDPADVVAVPVDYNGSKMRVCRFTVRRIVTNPTNKLLVSGINQPEIEASNENCEAEDDNEIECCDCVEGCEFCDNDEDGCTCDGCCEIEEEEDDLEEEEEEEEEIDDDDDDDQDDLDEEEPDDE